MGRERRAFPRRPVRWYAEISGGGLEAAPVTIRDFCAGGLFLQYPRDGAERPPGLAIPERVTVRFADPSERSECRCEARVVRDTGTGIALSFGQARPDVVTVLAAVAEGRTGPPSQGQQTASRVAEEVTALCEREAQAFAREVMPDFAAHAVDELFERSRGAATNAEQSAFFAAYRRLRDAQAHLVDDYARRLCGRVRGMADATGGLPATDGPATSVSELALVDEDDFEDWLNRSEIVSCAESRYANSLDALTRRLSHVLGRRLDEQSNPLAPAALSETLADSLPEEEPDPPVSRALYQLFGRVVLESLGELYDRLNRELKARQILPGIEEEGPEIRSLGANRRADSDRRRHSPREERQEDPQGAAPLPDADFAHAGDAGDTQPLQLNWERRPAPAVDDGSRAATAPASAPIPQSTPERPSAATVLRAQQALRQAREGAGGRGSDGRAGGGAPAEPPVAPGAPAVEEALLQKVAALQEQALSKAAPPESRPPGNRLMASLGEAEIAALAPETRATIELMDDWFGDVGENALNTDFLRDWSGRLAMCALRLQLQSGDFLDAQTKPIHTLLDQLDRAGVALSTLRPDQREALRSRLETILEAALREQAERPEAVAEAAEQMGALIDRPMRTRAANMQKVLQQCEGSQRLERARVEVNRALDQRLARREVPKLLLDFVDETWRHLLVLVRLRTEGQGDHWRRALAVVDRLLAVLGTGAKRPRPIPEHAKVFAFIRRELTAFGRSTPEAEQRVETMRAYAEHVCREGRGPRPLAMTRAPVSSGDESAAENISPHWLGQAKLVRPGDWVFFAGNEREPEPLRLQWVDDERTRFVFVNRSGYKAREASLVELAQLMEAAAAEVSEDLDAPLTERQWQRKLQAMHEEMIRFATRDSLTGLLNRRAMTQELDRLGEAERSRGRTKALLYFAIDSFKVVNTTLGYEIGDHLLVEVATQLRAAAGEVDHVARVGADEFAVFLDDCTATRAEIFAEDQRQKINALRVGDSGNSISAAVSVGVVTFQFGAQRAHGVLKDAHEACLAAKEAGGNRVHTITPDDRELQELRGSMARAARVDAALEAGDLQLRGQPIVPLAADTAAAPYFEVLIAMGGDRGEVLSPGEFIPAAERFGRMPSVDRWVITHVLEWCAANPDKVAAAAGFTINLAGPTLADRQLGDFVAAELERTGVAPEKICFEVTETTAVQNLARAADLIEALRRMGCRFSLDDFGTGHASYAYLKNLPIDFLKIDGELIRRIDEDEADFAMVRSINELAHYLGKCTIAEYVENHRILARLRELGVDYAQGYAMGYPEALDALRIGESD